MRDFRKYEVWKRSISFGKAIYELTADFPESERYGMTSQLQRAAVSVSSNIAEGCSRSSEKDFARFIEISLGSAFEVESQLYLCQDLGYIDKEKMERLVADLVVLQKQLNTLRTKLRKG